MKFILLFALISTLTLSFPAPGQEEFYKYMRDQVENDLYMLGGCRGTRHGCCPDGVTSKASLEDECLETRHMKGGCRGTRYGCCPDGVTAKGRTGERCLETKAEEVFASMEQDQSQTLIQDLFQVFYGQDLKVKRNNQQKRLQKLEEQKRRLQAKHAKLQKELVVKNETVQWQFNILQKQVKIQQDYLLAQNQTLVNQTNNTNNTNNTEFVEEKFEFLEEQLNLVRNAKTKYDQIISDEEYKIAYEIRHMERQYAQKMARINSKIRKLEPANHTNSSNHTNHTNNSSGQTNHTSNSSGQTNHTSNSSGQTNHTSNSSGQSNHTNQSGTSNTTNNRSEETTTFTETEDQKQQYNSYSDVKQSAVLAGSGIAGIVGGIYYLTKKKKDEKTRRLEAMSSNSQRKASMLISHQL